MADILCLHVETIWDARRHVWACCQCGEIPWTADQLGDERRGAERVGDCTPVDDSAQINLPRMTKAGPHRSESQ